MRDDVLKVSETIRGFLQKAHSSHSGSAGRFTFAPGEETITGIMLVEIKTRVPATRVIAKPTRRTESIEGHDWVWTIQARFGYHTFRIQSKRLYPNGRYELVTHHAGRPADENMELQVDKLIDACLQRRHVPLYALYNPEIADFAQSTVDLGACCQKRLQRHDPTIPYYSPMGVTVFDAHWLKYQLQPVGPTVVPRVPATADLNGATMPIECLFDCPIAGPAPGVRQPQGHGGDPAIPPGGPNRSGDSHGAGDPRGDGPTDEASVREGLSASGDDGHGHEQVLGLRFHPYSHMRKLAATLRGGDYGGDIVGFSEERPEYLSKLDEFESALARAAELEADAEPRRGVWEAELNRQSSSIEEPVRGAAPPDFYVVSYLE